MKLVIKNYFISLFVLIAPFFHSVSGASAPVELLEKKLLKVDETTAWHEYRMQSKMTGEFRLWHRGPREAQGPLPVIFLLAGIDSNQSSLDLVSSMPHAHVFSIDYKIPNEISGSEFASTLGKRYVEITGEVLAALYWLKQNSEQYDMKRFTSFNISFGTFIAPLVLRTAKSFNLRPRATVFAFGGAQVSNFASPFLSSIEDEALRDRAEELLEKAVAPIDPSVHLKHLSGPFLVIRSTQDEIIPAGSADALQNNLPAEGKTVLTLDTPHIDGDQPEAIQQTLAAALIFLKLYGAL